MSDDEAYKSRADILTSRSEFPGWKRRMEMIAQSRGDTEGVFADRGQNPLVGYQTIPNGNNGNIRRKEWNELSIKLSGKVGGMRRVLSGCALSAEMAARSPRRM